MLYIYSIFQFGQPHLNSFKWLVPVISDNAGSPLNSVYVLFVSIFSVTCSALKFALKMFIVKKPSMTGYNMT